MRYLKTYKLFESSFEVVKSMIETLQDLSQDFEDNNCKCRIEPSNDIRIKVMALRSKGEVFQDINMPFYIEIDIDRRVIAPNEKRTAYGWVNNKRGFGPLPDWFIDSCKRIEDYMQSEGFKTLPSIRYGTDWENLESIDELAEQQSLIYKVKLEFFKIERISESHEMKIMKVKYGEQALRECDSIIDDIKDMLLELKDMGLIVGVAYTPMTLAGMEDSPKIRAEAQGDSVFCSRNKDEIISTFERIKEYARLKGYVTGFGTWERAFTKDHVIQNWLVYEILIQK